MKPEYKKNLLQRIKYDCCPLCNSQNLSTDYQADCSKHPLYIEEIPSTMQWINCNECGHQFVDGYFSNESLSVIFSKTNENQKVGYQIEKQRTVSSKIIEKVLSYQLEGNWLDIGFGNGNLLFTAQEYGFNPVGIDLRKANVNSLKQIGIEAYCEPVENINFEKNFSVISMMDVLEHMPYPKVVLKKLSTISKKDGCIIISMPNSETLLWGLMNQNNSNPYLGELEHYHNFSRTRIYLLLEEYGFKPVKYGISDRYRCCMEILAIKK